MLGAVHVFMEGVVASAHRGLYPQGAGGGGASRCPARPTLPPLSLGGRSSLGERGEEEVLLGVEVLLVLLVTIGGDGGGGGIL